MTNKILALFIITITTNIAHALPSDSSQPIRLSADKATYSESTGVMTYLGNVIITQGSLKISASNITVQLSATKSIDSAIATGSPARFEQIVSTEKGLSVGSANKIDYNAKTGIITLTGNAQLTQAGASFSGNRLRYSLKAGDIEAISGGGQRVELVLPPNNNTSQQAIRQ